MVDVVDEEHRAAAAEVRRVLAVWNDIEDLVNVGAYAAGANLEFDVAVKMKPAIDAFVQQTITEQADYEESRKGLGELAAGIREARRQLESSVAAAAVQQSS
jgi:flagellar biosynthesis/type III secretory pathway ATPase